MESQTMPTYPFTTPREFFAAFSHVTSDKHDELARMWLMKRPYTTFILGTVFPLIAARLGLEAWIKNYYYLDSVFFRETDTSNFSADVMNATYFDIALEHEHDIRGTAQEIIKLQVFNTPLKVLITYDTSDRERNGHLKQYGEIIKAADIFSDIASRRRQLVIFGRIDSGKIEWSPYVYEDAGFVRVPKHS
jgi:hypothetical protein